MFECRECRHYRATERREVETETERGRQIHVFYIAPFCTLYPKWQQVEEGHYCGQFAEEATNG